MSTSRKRSASVGRKFPVKRPASLAGSAYFKPFHLDYSFQFPVHLVRNIFYKQLTCLFCVKTDFSHGSVRDLQHVEKCESRTGDFEREASTGSVSLVESTGEWCAAFYTDFYNHQIELFTKQLNIQRAQQDRQLDATNSSEYTTVSSKLKLHQATIFVDHLSPEVVSFIDSSVQRKPLLEAFGFYRLRPREPRFATTPFNRIKRFNVKFETLQTCVPAANSAGQLYHINHTSKKKTRGSLTISALYNRGQKAVGRESSGDFVLENDQDYFEFLKKADSASNSILYGENLSGCVPGYLGYHHFTKLQLDSANLLSHLEHHLIGISTPSGYVGTAGSTFALRTEDEDFGSVSQLVFGHNRVFFVSPPSEYPKIINLSKRLFRKGGSECSNPTRHNTLFIPIEILRANHIAFTRIEQSAGDAIVLAPRAFYFGYNKGINLALAVNFLALHPSEGEAFRSQTVYCNCGEPNLRFTDDFRNLENVVWAKDHWAPVIIQQKTPGQRPLVRSEHQKKTHQKKLGVTVKQPNSNNDSGIATYSLRMKRELTSFRSAIEL